MAQRILASTRKGLFDIRKSSSGWGIEQVHFLGDNLSLAYGEEKSGLVLAAFNHGHFGVKMKRSRDGGKTFHDVKAPAYPPQPPPPTDPAAKKDVDWALKLVWSLERGARGELWCGTIPGGLFVSRDDGESWQLIESLWNRPERKEWFGGGYPEAGIHSVITNKARPDEILVGVSCAGVWRSVDGGKSWEQRAKGMRAEFMPPEKAYDQNIQDPHRVVQCRDQPDLMWAQHHNGIFKTVDGGANWTELTGVKPSVFGFAAAVHPADGNTVWLVPAIKDEKRVPVDGKMVVNRTRDGGKTWQTLSKGLPQQHAYDLVYRHGLDVDSTGTQLVMASTTGSLWISEDQGDAWTALSEHLPPVHAVRFVE